MASSNSEPVKYFICGGVGGICTVLTGHSLDTVKVRLQTMPKPAPGQPPKYTGMLDCVRKIIAQEGFYGLYKGISAPLVSVVPIFAISFLSYSVGKHVQQKQPTDELSLYQCFLAGAFAGICCTTIMAPGERIKCLLQTQTQNDGKQKYSGMLDAGLKLYKEGGIRSVYKGTTATLLRDIPATGMYFMTYEYFQKLLTPAVPATGKMGQVSFFSTVFAGGMAGVSSWILGMPADVLKSRLQSAPEGTYPQGLRSVFAELMQKEGPRGLYKGIIPVMIRAFPANAACFIGFEGCMKFLNWITPMLH